MKIIYMGTPDFAVPALEQLVKHHDVMAVYTQPDRPAGRGHKLQMSAVKAAALAAGLPVVQPQTLRIKKNAPSMEAINARAQLKAYDADIFVVAAYGLILPKAVLDMPRLGCINIHASLLPKYRGASPIQAAILNGEEETGITIMHMDTGIDTGDMILKRETAINKGERIQSLHDRLAVLGGECILEAVDLLEKGKAKRIPQNHAASSYAPMIKKQDAQIDWTWPSERIINLTRAFDPWPGPFTHYGGDVIKIWRVETTDLNEDMPPVPAGMVLAADPTQGLLVRTGDGAVYVKEMQPSGGKRMAAEEYLRGRSMDVGDVLI